MRRRRRMAAHPARHRIGGGGEGGGARAKGVAGRRVEILLVEDSPGDVRLTREALREGPRRGRLSVAADGVEALAFLRREGRYAAAARPDVILLDLNLPRLD